MSPLALAVLLSLVSAVAYAAGAIMQERAAAASPDRPYAPLHRAGWWCAILLNSVGAVLHVVALAYGSLSVVQPLGALTIVFALPMAALFAGRRAGASAWRGALAATVGLAGLLAVAGDTGSHTLSTGQRGLLGGVTFGAVALLFLVARTVHRPVRRGVLLASAAGVAFGIASVFTKTVAAGWQWSRPVAEWPAMAVIAALALGGLLLSQASYRGAGLAAPLATVTVVNPVVAAVVGVTVFGEGFRHGVVGTLLAIGFGALAASGLVLLTIRRSAAGGRTEHTTAGRPGSHRRPAPSPSGRRPSRTAVGLNTPAGRADRTDTTHPGAHDGGPGGHGARLSPPGEVFARTRPRTPSGRCRVRS